MSGNSLGTDVTKIYSSTQSQGDASSGPRTRSRARCGGFSLQDLVTVPARRLWAHTHNGTLPCTAVWSKTVFPLRPYQYRSGLVKARSRWKSGNTDTTSADSLSFDSAQRFASAHVRSPACLNRSFNNHSLRASSQSFLTERWRLSKKCGMHWRDSPPRWT